jgi:hypothetical protein
MPMDPATNQAPAVQDFATWLTRLPKAELPYSRWVGTRRVALRYVSSSPPLSTVHATFTAHGAAPLVILHGYP